MGRMVVRYPDLKEDWFYYGLQESFGVATEVWDGTLDPPGMRPKTQAEIKFDTDATVRDYLQKRVRAIYRRDRQQVDNADFDSTYEDVDLTE